MKTATRTILACTILGFAGMSVGYATGGGSPSVTAGLGSATVTVLHSVTHRPLPAMPVSVASVITPEGKPQVYWTGRAGSVLVTNLEEGTYVAYVDYNNHVSDPVRFQIIGDYHPNLTIYFNPDIDR